MALSKRFIKANGSKIIIEALSPWIALIGPKTIASAQITSARDVGDQR
jgi:hypothetical protein